jgi:tetrahydromethanopterin S-methyltransferase subunit A
MIDNEDAGAIEAKVKECIEKDPGAFEEDAYVISLDESGDEEDDGEEIRPVAPETALIEARIRNINTQVKMVGALQRTFSGNYAGKVQGIAVGLAFTLIIGILFLLI